MSNRVWEEISFDRLENNLNVIKRLSNNKKITCIVKDDAYGLGSVQVSKFLEKDDLVIAFAVASLKEANTLKNNGIKKNILIISHIFEDEYEEAIKNNYIITISTLKQAEIINDIAKKNNINARIEISIDTGMGRIGFDLSCISNIDTIVEDVEKISHLSNVNIYGFYSHFSVADEVDDIENENWTENQYQKFTLFMNKIDANNINYEDSSISNSSAILKGIGFDMKSIRPGIILYGILPIDKYKNVGILPIMQLKSKITHIKEVEKGTYISYGRSYMADKKMRVATISCGYGDGYKRSLSNKASVIINDTKCKIIGRITMDAFMVDVTGVNCDINDEVILIGESPNNKIELEEICSLANEFTYEMLVSINKRVERVYKA